MDITFDNSDAPEFQEMMSFIIHKLVQTLQPNEISIVRINNWFDHKWLNYSGKQIQKFDSATHPNIPFVLEPYWNNEVTIPPFHPNRVLSESKFRKTGTKGETFEQAFHVFQESSKSNSNLISRRTNNGLCIWISSNTITNKQGSIMVYQIKNAQIETWYASMEEKGKWCVSKTKGIDKNHLQSILDDFYAND